VPQRTTTHIWEMGLLLLQDSDCAWNRLPSELRQPDLSLGQFRRTLNTHLFCWWPWPFCFMAPCINVLAFLLTYLLTHSLFVFFLLDKLSWSALNTDRWTTRRSINYNVSVITVITEIDWRNAS